MNIRVAQRQDMASIQALYQVLFQQMAQYEPEYQQAASQDIGFLEAVIAQKDNFMAYIAEVEGDVKGVIILQKQQTLPYNCLVPKNSCFILDVVVSADMRGQGLGHALIQQAKQWAQAQEVHYLELSVLAKNERAMALYVKEGFTSYSTLMRLPLAPL